MFLKYAKKTQILIVLAVFVVGALIFFGCERGPKVIKIGSILPLTGDAAQWGAEPQKAIQLAVDELNARGGINGKKIEVIFEDTQATPKIGVSAFNKLIRTGEIKAVVGPVTSAVTLSIAPIANQNKIVVISPSATSHEITTAGGEFVFRTISSDIYEGAVMAEVAYTKYGYRKVSILGVNDAGVVGMTNSFEKRFKELGGEVVLYEKGERGALDFKSLLSKIKNQSIDALYLVGYPSDTGRMVKQAKEIGLQAPLLSAQPAEDPQVRQIAGDAVEGLLYTSTTLPPDVLGEAYQNFEAKFQKKYNKKPGSFAAEAYDAFNLIVQAIRQVGNDGEKIKDYLHTVKNYNGASGIMTFDEYGDVKKPVVVIAYGTQQNVPVLLFKDGSITNLK